MDRLYVVSTMGMFERDTDIYRDRDALREDYQPEQLVGRDGELDTYRAALQPVINGEQPNNVFLGKTGVERPQPRGTYSSISVMMPPNTTTSNSPSKPSTVTD